MTQRLDPAYYSAPRSAAWQGRHDGDTEAHLRWHQHIQLLNLQQDLPQLTDAFVLLGFACDEGVRRNLGRVGASEGPAALRNALRNAPIFRDHKVALYDAGDINCLQTNLETAQQVLGSAIQQIRQQGGFPIILGGGHEVTYGHYLGLTDSTPNKLGILNLDAHFDCRTPNPLTSSGTGFFQITEAEAAKGNKLSYLPIGIQRISNTQALFDFMEARGLDWLEAADFHHANQQQIQNLIDRFLESVDQLYLTIDLDVFAAPFAPGVSAVAFNGIIPDAFFWRVFREIVQSPKLISIDIAELNPLYDPDMRTAKLAANLIFELISAKKRIVG